MNFFFQKFPGHLSREIDITKPIYIYIYLFLLYYSFIIIILLEEEIRNAGD